MYADPARWAYLFQSYCLLTMMEAHSTPQVCLNPRLYPPMLVYFTSHSSYNLTTFSHTSWRDTTSDKLLCADIVSSCDGALGALCTVVLH